jgi:hypothetical protein
MQPFATRKNDDGQVHCISALSRHCEERGRARHCERSAAGIVIASEARPALSLRAKRGNP